MAGRIFANALPPLSDGRNPLPRFAVAIAGSPGLSSRSLLRPAVDGAKSPLANAPFRRRPRPVLRTATLLERFEDIFFLDGFDVDYPIRMEANLGQCRSEQVWTSQAPNYLAFGTGCNTGNKECGCSSVNGPYPTSGKFVNRAICQASARKVRVNLCHPKRKDRFQSSRRPFEMLDTVSKLGNDRVRAVLRHSEPSSKQVFISFKSEYVHYLFPINI